MIPDGRQKVFSKGHGILNILVNHRRESGKDFWGCEVSQLCSLIRFHGATANWALSHIGSGASMSLYHQLGVSTIIKYAWDES